MASSDCITFSVYRIVNFRTGKVYIGKTKDTKRRKREHFHELELNKHHSKYLQYSYNKWGKSAFYFEVLETELSPDVIEDRERYWVAYFDSYSNGYNETFGGDGRGRNGVKTIWNGIEYPTRREAAHACGINDTTMHQRLKRGHTCDADLIGATGKFATKKPGWNKTPCQWNGITYPSITACAGAYNVSIATMLERLQKGYSSDADLRLTNSEPCVWDGIEYSSIAEAARANNVSHSAMLNRLKRGKTRTDQIRKRTKPKSTKSP